MDRHIPERYKRTGLVLPSDFPADAPNAYEDVLPDLLRTSQNEKPGLDNMAVTDDSTESLLNPSDLGTTLRHTFDFNDAITSSSNTSLSQGLLMDPALDFNSSVNGQSTSVIQNQYNREALNQNQARSFQSQQAAHRKQQLQLPQQHQQQRRLNAQIHQEPNESSQQKRGQPSFLDFDAHEATLANMSTDSPLWDIYSGTDLSPRESGLPASDTDSFSFNSENTSSPFYPFAGESINQQTSLLRQSDSKKPQQSTQALQSYAQYARQQSIRHQQQLQERQKQQQQRQQLQQRQKLQQQQQLEQRQQLEKRQQLEQQQKKQLLEREKQLQLQERQKQQQLERQNQLRQQQAQTQAHAQAQQQNVLKLKQLQNSQKNDHYSDLLRARSASHTPRMTRSSSSSILATSQAPNTRPPVSPGLFATTSRPNQPSSLQNIYRGADYSPQHGPVQFAPQQGPVNFSPQTVPVAPLQTPQQMLLNQALLSPPLTRLQGESPTTEVGYFSQIPPHEAELMLMRQKYKVKSSIPSDVSSAHYGQQCISATISSRLSPFCLHEGEYSLLADHISPIHATSYLNIRNGILRLWLSNPKVNVTRSEAAGCARDERYFNLAEVAYDWLVRNGYINFGCFEYPVYDFYNAIPEDQRKPRRTVVIIGAGIAGLSCARQLENLFRRKARHFAAYQDVPRVLVLEGRRRIGGRIYSAHLKSDPSHAIDVGAHIIPGYGNGNPLAILIRRQLGLPVEIIKGNTEIHDALSREKVNGEEQERARKLFEHLLERVAQFQQTVRHPKSARGDEALIKLSQDPPRDSYENITLAKANERNAIKENQLGKSEYKSDIEWQGQNSGKIEVQFLKKLGIRLKPGVAEDTVIHVAPEPQLGMYPSLGRSMDALLRQLQDISEITPLELRVLNWYYAKLESQSATCLDVLSLGSWNQNSATRFTGQPSAVKDGYMSLARGLYTYEEKLDVRFKSCANVIEYSDDGAEVFLENEEQIKADCVVVTAPLGVLKDRTIQFIPDLPEWKSGSIEKLGFGVINKVCLVFDRSFWEENRDVISISQPHDGKNPYDQDSYKNTRGFFSTFYNVTKVVGKPCLIGLIVGAAAKVVAGESDEFMVEAALKTLDCVYPGVRDNKLVESVVTRWHVDRYARGSYSYLGVEATDADYDLLAQPIGKSLFFAGEATCRDHAGTVHGAYLSGLRAASEVLTSLIGEISVPQPLVPSKDYRAQSTVQQRPTLPNHATPTSSMGGTPESVQQPLQISSLIPSSLDQMHYTMPGQPSSQYTSPGKRPLDDNGEARLKPAKAGKKNTEANTRKKRAS